MMKYIKKWSETSLILRIILGLIVGTILALTVPQLSGIGILGDLFVGILKAIAPFLVFFIIMSVIPKTSSNLGSRFKLVITLYLLSMMLAAIVSVTASFLFPVSVPLTASVDPSTSGAPLAIGSVFSKILTDMISNPVTALIEGKYISILQHIKQFSLSSMAQMKRKKCCVIILKSLIDMCSANSGQVRLPDSFSLILAL